MSEAFIPPAKPFIGDEERHAVDRVLLSGMIAGGPEVAAFESEFSAAAVAGALSVAVNSGTSALHMGLVAAGVKPGDEVIVPSFTFAATANSVALAGGTPVFADIDLDTFNLDAADVANRITERTVAIMPVHLYGQAADMDAFGYLAAKHNLQLFEDCAQAHLSTWDGKQVGSIGTFGAFSFYPTKNMTSGEGGMVTTRDEEFARLVKLLRNQGMERRYENEVVGFNTRLTDVHAAIGRVQLGRLEQWTAKRQANAKFFDENLQGVVVPAVAAKATHVYHQYTIRVGEDRDGFAEALKNEYGIGTGVYYPIPNHELPSFNRDLELPVTAQAAAQVLSLPVYPTLTEAELERIVTGINAVAKAGA